MKKLLVIILVVISVMVTLGVSAVNPSDWAQAEVDLAISAGFVPEELQSEYTNGITRGEFANLAVRFTAYRLGYTLEELINIVEAENSEAIQFSDTQDEFVKLASIMGIVKGMGDGSFCPDEGITRGQAAVMLMRTYKNFAGSYSIAYSMNFEDRALIPDWAFTEIQFCMANKVMQGVSETHFDPQGSYTREQAIATFVRMSNIEEWKRHNSSARYRRKMTKDEAVEEYINQPMLTLNERFDTPYGTALYCVMGGMMHAPGYFITFFDNDASCYDLSAPVPRESFYAKPALENLTLSEDMSKLTFEVTFNSRAAYQADGEVVLHEKGTYYFEADLKTVEVEMRFEPNPTGEGIETDNQ